MSAAMFQKKSTVSIPNGKGKEGDKTMEFNSGDFVSIPNGKGKEQQFQVHFYYTYQI